MDTSHVAKPALVRAVPSFPNHTIRCRGEVSFRSQSARDYGYLLDVDDQVDVWSCQTAQLETGTEVHRPDFTVYRDGGRELVDVVIDSRSGPPPSIVDAATSQGFNYRVIRRSELPSVRLKNARDLLRYARFEVPLSDRIRLLAALDAEGTLTVAECLSAFQRNPIPSLASLILHRFIAIDLDERLIGPETQVRRRCDF